mmetsp:Transcript_16541/g.37289  ORF Transcript_16541/g.37289 Transcript_16541/m.37289 type:complete len:201 (-) Transcript_16541:955-1557(-)
MTRVNTAACAHLRSGTLARSSLRRGCCPQLLSPLSPLALPQPLRRLLLQCADSLVVKRGLQCQDSRRDSVISLDDPREMQMLCPQVLDDALRRTLHIAHRLSAPRIWPGQQIPRTERQAHAQVRKENLVVFREAHEYGPLASPAVASVARHGAPHKAQPPDVLEWKLDDAGKSRLQVAKGGGLVWLEDSQQLLRSLLTLI